MIDPIPESAPTTVIESNAVRQDVPIRMELVATTKDKVELKLSDAVELVTPERLNTALNEIKAIISSNTTDVDAKTLQGKKPADFALWDHKHTKSEITDFPISAPIGYVYVQYPDQLAPNELFGGTWENISSQYAGRFFRAEGGNAGTFGDNQGDAIRNISGWIGSICTYVNDPTSAIGVHSVIENRDYPRGSAQAAHIVFDASRQVPTAEENRPINTAIRLWKRIA